MAPLTERVADRHPLPPGKLRVDRDACVVYGLQFVGPNSANGWDYPEPFLRSGLTLLDGIAINWGHHYDPVTLRPTEVPPDDKLARGRNPRMDGNRIVGDAHYNPKCPHAEKFLWACENDPGFYALSQLAAVHRRPELAANGNKIADRYLSIASLDVVATGASSSSLIDADLTDPLAVPGATMPTDPKTVAAEFATGDDLKTFLTGLFQALPGTIDKTAQQAAVDAVQSWLDGSGDVPADGTGDAAVSDALRKRGKFGRRAAIVIDNLRVEREKKARAEWADTLMRAEQLPDDLRTEVFAEMVADCHGNETWAKSLIADRKALAPAKAGSLTSPAGGGGTKSVKEIVAEMAIG